MVIAAPLKSVSAPSTEKVRKALSAGSPRGFRLVGERARDAAVEPVDDHAEVEPDEKPDPRDDRQREHQIETGQGPERRDQERPARNLGMGDALPDA